MTDRERVAAVIVRGASVLMVRERMRGPDGRHDGPEYWTLPGGGVKAGESKEDAVRREVAEETGLVCTALFRMFDYSYPAGPTTCFRVEAEPGTEPQLGVDQDLDCDCPRMIGLDWVPLHPAMNDDLAAPVMLIAAPE